MCKWRYVVIINEFHKFIKECQFNYKILVKRQPGVYLAMDIGLTAVCFNFHICK